jgi:hypothetical protein
MTVDFGSPTNQGIKDLNSHSGANCAAKSLKVWLNNLDLVTEMRAQPRKNTYL